MTHPDAALPAHPGAILPPYAAIVLAGGAATRMGGRHKPALPVAGIPLLDRVLAAVPDATPRVVVGPPQPVPHDVLLTRETPPGGGPAAALAAGLTLLPAPPPPFRHRGGQADHAGADRDPTDRHPGDHDRDHDQDSGPPGFVAVLAGDQALLTGAAVRALRRAAAGAAAGVGGAVFVDRDGREQWLCGVWRIDLLRERIAERGGWGGVSVRRVLGGVGAVPVRWSGVGLPPWFDCDTEEQVAAAEAWLAWLGDGGRHDLG